MSTFRPRVMIESPFAGKGATEEERVKDEKLKLRYLRFCLRDSILRGEAPFASHAIYTQPWVLDDRDPEERALGIACGFAFREVTNFTGIEHADSIGHAVTTRYLDKFQLEKVFEALC